MYRIEPFVRHQFCNGMQLNRVLPPGPREYWSELVSQHKAAPEHQRWMYDADPFAARKEVEERQAKATQKKEEKVTALQGDTHKSSIAPEFTQAPEVRMSSTLRGLVEDTVKKGRSFLIFNSRVFISLICRPVYFTRHMRQHLWYWWRTMFLQ